MIPWQEIERLQLAGGETLALKRRGAEFSIMLGANTLMNSRQRGSEEALARLACARLRDTAHAHVLIGGLGMGFTLRAALAALGADARIVVAELLPAVVAWARGPMAEVFGGCLDDRRTQVLTTDVAALLRARPRAWDAILLDVDNGPDGLTQEANSWLYGAAGLAAARRALTPGGVLAVWSSGPSRSFTERLRKAGFSVEEHTARANGARGAKQIIWVAAA